MPAASGRGHDRQRLRQQPGACGASERGVPVDLVYVNVDDDHTRGCAGWDGKVRARPLPPPRLHLPGVGDRLVETALGNRTLPAWRAREHRHIETGQLARDEWQRHTLAEPVEDRSDRRGPTRDQIVRRASVAYLSHRQASLPPDATRQWVAVRP
jgi:hypothetical protein